MSERSSREKASRSLSSQAWLQRLVGIAVLALASLLLWPILFDEGPVHMLDPATQIPPPPTVVDYEVAPPKPVAAVPVVPASVDEDQPAPAVQSATEAQSTPLAKVTDSAALTAQGLPQSWVVQVGSFASQANADALKAKLREKGYPAFTKGNPADKNAAIRVFVGPKLSRERADQIKLDLQKNLGLKPFVTPMGN